MNMTRWNEWAIKQDLLYGLERASLDRARICLDRSNDILIRLFQDSVR
jgi:hypothetical protein